MRLVASHCSSVRVARVRNQGRRVALSAAFCCRLALLRRRRCVAHTTEAPTTVAVISSASRTRLTPIRSDVRTSRGDGPNSRVSICSAIVGVGGRQNGWWPSAACRVWAKARSMTMNGGNRRSNATRVRPTTSTTLRTRLMFTNLSLFGGAVDAYRRTCGPSSGSQDTLSRESIERQEAPD